MVRREVPLQEFQKTIWQYYRQHKRDLPWRRTRNPYRVLVSEVMLQQTQVERVVPKYKLFLKRFPTFRSLAQTSFPKILRVWQGLGYNRRALALKKLSEIVVHKYKSTLPRDPDLLQDLPGIGKATAGAISTFAFGQRISFIETNIRRVFLHFFFPRRKKVDDAEVLRLIVKTLPRRNLREWYFALMDYGSMLGAKGKNPNWRSAHYRRQSPFRGSRRELRGKIVELLLAQGLLPKAALEQYLSQSSRRIECALRELVREGFIYEKKGKVGLAP